MTAFVGIGVVLIAAALCAAFIAIFQPEIAGLRSEQLRVQDGLSSLDDKPAGPIRAIFERIVHVSKWHLFSDKELEVAGIRHDPTNMLMRAVTIGMVAFVVALAFTSSFLLGIVAFCVGVYGMKLWVGRARDRRRARFNSQLPEALSLLSSALKSGMNVTGALTVVAGEIDAPMGEELTRIVNENSLGRDLIEAMEDVAERMDSTDFKWLSEGMSVQRESGGRLSEIIDRITQTIAERTELQEKIHALSAEGRISAYVLMGLPIFVGVGYYFMNPDFITPLFTTGVGRILLGISMVFYVIGGVWLKSITKVRF